MTMGTELDRWDEGPERWSAKARSEVVLRLLRGEASDLVSRELQVPVHELEAYSPWERTYVIPICPTRSSHHRSWRYGWSGGESDTRRLEIGRAHV